METYELELLMVVVELSRNAVDGVGIVVGETTQQ